MSKPNWNKVLSEVLGHKTQSLTLVSEKTGNEYTVDTIPFLKVLSIGSYEETDDGKFKYPIVDLVNKLEYSIKVPNSVEVSFGTMLHFKNVRGGATSKGSGWYSADSVSVAEK